MKTKNFMAEHKKLSAKELSEKKRALAEELFKLRLRKASGQLEQTHQLTTLKRDLARVKTLLAAAK